MSYQLFTRREQKRKQFILQLIVGFFVLIVFVLFLTIFGSGITGVTSGTASLVRNTEVVVEQGMTSKQDLIKENTLLKAELERVEIMSVLQDGLRERNQKLEEELGRRAEVKVLAGIVKKPPYTPYDIYTTDAGSVDGVAIGDIAVSGDYVVLGVVTRAGEQTSKVNLFSSAGRRTIVEINGYAAEAEGMGSGTIRIAVPRDFEALQGDLVTLPGFGFYVVGTVVDVVQKPQDSFKSLMVKVPLNTHLLSYISIIPYTVESDE